MNVPVKRAALGLAGMFVRMRADSALAHHSFARFDADRQVKLQGTVHEFERTNPHASVIGKDARRMGHRDQRSEWLSAPGWQPRTLASGMPVTLTIHPRRDGTNGGQFMDVTLPGGAVMGLVTTPSQ
jgi:hypothetical protein